MLSKSPLVCLLLLLGWLHAACTTKVYTTYPHGGGLEAMVSHATTDEIAKMLGPPTTYRVLSDGGEVWAYDYRTATLGGTQSNTAGTSECSRLILTFDKNKVLRELRHRRC